MPYENSGFKKPYFQFITLVTWQPLIGADLIPLFCIFAHVVLGTDFKSASTATVNLSKEFADPFKTPSTVHSTNPGPAQKIKVNWRSTRGKVPKPKDFST